MSEIFYGYGVPAETVPHELYVDLDTDTMYIKTNGVWEVYAYNGVPTGSEHLM